MSENENTDKTEHNEDDSPVDALPVKRAKKLEKKPVISTKGKVSKPTKQRISSPRLRAKQLGSVINRNQLQEQLEQRQQKKGNDSFYRGALVGSFLGATLSTVITNAIAKLLG